MNIIRNTLILGIASASLLCLDNLPVNIGQMILYSNPELKGLIPEFIIG